MCRRFAARSLKLPVRISHFESVKCLAVSLCGCRCAPSIWPEPRIVVYSNAANSQMSISWIWNIVLVDFGRLHV